MPCFAFDESKPIEDNLEAFFAHLATYDPTFSDYLRVALPKVVGDGFDRASFNKAVVDMLDDPRQPPSENR